MPVVLQEKPRQMARNDTAVKIETDIVRQARLIAARRNITVAEYLSEILRATVVKDYRQAVRDMAAEIDSPKQKKEREL
jgi:hypothetical protein